MNQPTFNRNPTGFEPDKPFEHTLLIVDDEDHILLALELLLRRAGYHVVTAHNANDALDVMRQQPISLVISDERLPDMLGRELLREIQKNWPDTIRVTLTGYANVDSVLAAINEGHVFQFLVKPWDDEELKAVVRDGLRLLDLLRENRRLYQITQRQSHELRKVNESLEQRVEKRTVEVEAKNQELEETFVQVVRTLSAIREQRGLDAAGHAEHVADDARELAVRLDVSKQMQNDIEIAAALHDIGMIGLPDELLERGYFRMTREEHAQYRKHAVVAQALLAGMPRMEAVVQIIRHQGEWWNGRSYPDKLLGEDIPIGSRIIACVDVYWERQQEWGALDGGRGQRFDPNVVDAYETLLSAREADLRAAPPSTVWPNELVKGMIVRQDVYTGRGLLLVTGGHVVDEATLIKIRRFNRVDPLRDKIYVRA